MGLEVQVIPDGGVIKNFRRGVVARRVLAVVLLLEWLYVLAASVVLIVFETGMARFDGEDAFASIDAFAVGLAVVAFVLPASAWWCLSSQPASAGHFAKAATRLGQIALAATALLHLAIAALLAVAVLGNEPADYPVVNSSLAIGALVFAYLLVTCMRTRE